MNSYNQRQAALRRLDGFELREASMWVASKWLKQFSCNDGRAVGHVDLAEFGAFEANLAEAIVLNHGSDFVFPKWGAALSTLCGGDHRGHRLSAFPQPSRSQLRRVCVRATAAQMPTADQATWVVGGRIWQCTMLAMPTAGDEFAATRLLVALLFAPHPIFASQLVLSEGHEMRRSSSLQRLEALDDHVERQLHFSSCHGQSLCSDNADQRAGLIGVVQQARSHAFRLMAGISNLRQKFLTAAGGRKDRTEA